MKKPISVLCLLLAAALLVPTAASAAPVDLAPSAEICAVLSLDGGGELLVERAPDAALMRAVDSYELYVEGEPALSVDRLGDRPTRQARVYYSVNFTFEGTQQEVFLTGLDGDRVEEIQQQIIASYATGEDFNMTDLGFIDAEKSWAEGDDDYMCWAASAADMLVYTGWAALAGFDTEDDAFETFIDNFADDGGHQYGAFAWFFNGSAYIDNSGLYGAVIEQYPGSGGYLKDYAYDALCGESSLYTAADMNAAAAHLREGCAVSLGVLINGEPDGGHAITLWGYVVDNALAADDPARYSSLFVTDSDSYEGINGRNDADRREADDVMSMYRLTYSDDADGFYYFWFDPEQYAVIDDYYYLEAYTENTAKETDSSASKDKLNDPDWCVESVFLTDTNGTREFNTLFESGTSVYSGFRIQNAADVGYRGYAYFSTQLLDADGNILYSSTPVYSVNVNPVGMVALPSFESFGSLQAGDYTLVCTVNPDRSADRVMSEAYYYNNVRSIPFKVRDSYLLGDYDGSGSIDIMDATKIQRMLADFEVNLDDNAAVRGDVNGSGLSILDVTQIQRSIADLSVDFPIGEKFLYD